MFCFWNRYQIKTIHEFSERVSNFKTAKLSGHLSRVKRETAQDRLQRAAKQQASGKNTLCLAKILSKKLILFSGIDVKNELGTSTYY